MFIERGILHFRRTSPYINACLLRQGCIGASPITPNVAITLRSLRLYRETHRVCPRFSIHAEAKKICRMHNVPYHCYLADQLRTAYDIYLALLRRIDTRISTALGRNSPDWRMLNSCPACQYHIVDEPPLRFSFLCAMDGNNSLKLVDPVLRGGKERHDPRDGRSPIWLKEDFVDAYKDEVRNSRTSPRTTQPATSPTNVQILASASGDTDLDSEWTDLADNDNDDGEPTDVCIDRWRNASPEARKKMFAIFKKSGVFVVVCRHGLLLTICDMVRSGELMKYPLASVKKLLDVCGPNICIGYDIKCRFWQVLLRSSLGPLAQRLNLSGVVQAFHGYAHNRYCQLTHHSKYMVGAGKEDFETCERTFSESNALAPETRFASEFHRHQAIDEHFIFADEEKYAALSKFIYNNYRQALTTVATAQAYLNVQHQTSSMTSADYDADLQAEREYLQHMHGKHDEKNLEVDYVQALAAMKAARLDLRNIDYGIIHRGFTRKEITEVQRRHTNSFSKVELRMQLAQDLERQLDIEERWAPNHPKRVAAQARITHRLFYKAADDVERLVAMRLLEMTKLQQSGYKLRTQISKALKTRATAIQNALARYNKYGAALDPPVKELKWEHVVEYTFLAEFDLIRANDSELKEKRWAQPLVREGALQYFDLQRAKEEIKRCNVEILRLLTKIYDDEYDIPAAIAVLEMESPSLATELKTRWEYLRGVNAMHLARIQQTQALKGYTGPFEPG
ncbi:hypothetical protein BJ138DRAFT_1020992, partial [Hygrophoropsis aurantiaca]